MAKSSKPSYLLLALVFVMGMGGWNLLVADLMFRAYRLLPKEMTKTTTTPNNHKDTGEKSAVKHPSSELENSAESEEESEEDEPDLDVFTMVATMDFEAGPLVLFPGIPNLSVGGATRFSLSGIKPIEVKV
jgi:hypothetical protein